MRFNLFIIISLIFFSLYVSGLKTSDYVCQPTIELIKQDPYPAVPGSNVELIFKINNIDSPNCGMMSFQIVEDFPFKIQEGFEKVQLFSGGNYLKDYSTFKIIPIKLNIDKDALNKDFELETRLRYGNLDGYLSKKFNISIQEVSTDFDVFLSEYDSLNKKISLEILNNGKNDANAITIEIPAQENVKFYGQNKKNIGDLTKNEDTRVDFNIDLNDSISKLKIIIYYSDIIQERRFVVKEMPIDLTIFESKVVQSKNYFTSYGLAIIILLIAIIGIFLYKKRKNIKS